MSECIARPGRTWTGCRCAPCRARRRRVDKAARLGILPPSRTVEAWAEVDELVRRGWSASAIASAAGVPERTIRGGLDERSRGRDHTWSRMVATAILRHAPAPTTGHIGVTGTSRRLQALAVLGWSVRAIAAETGTHWRTIHVLRAPLVERTGPHNAAVAAELYDRLGMTPGPSRQTARCAVAAGWAPPLAWEGIDIDDPDTVPDLGQRTPVRVDLDEWAMLVRCGEEPHRAARRCGVSLNAVEMAAGRLGRDDVRAVLSQARRGERVA